MELENKVKELDEKNCQLEYEKACFYVIKKFNNIFLGSLIPVIPFALSNSSLKNN